MTWFYYSLAAAMFWGVSYTLSEKILRKVDVSTYLAYSYLFEFLIIFLFGCKTGKLKLDLQTIESSTWALMTLIAILQLCGNYCISTSIQGKNASLASIIEISYPFFTIASTYLLFKENQVTFGSIVGSAFVFIGVAIILKGC